MNEPTTIPTMPALPSTAVAIHVAIDGRIDHDIMAYARLTLESAIRSCRGRISRAEVRLVRYPDPALPQPVVARANLNVDGRLLQIHALGTDTRRAVDDLGEAVHEQLGQLRPSDPSRLNG